MNRDQINTKLQPPLTRIRMHLFDWLVGFGYRPWRAIGYSIIFMILGWVLFGLGYKNNIIRPSDAEKAFPNQDEDTAVADPNRNSKFANSEVSPNYTLFNAFIYSFENFVPLLTLDMGKYWRPNANINANFRLLSRDFILSGKFLRAYLWFHVIVGWALTTLWVGALSGVVKN